MHVLLRSAVPSYRPILVCALFTGMRLSELLGLTWRDIDFEAEVIRVRHQLSRSGERTRLKSHAAVRDIPLLPQLARLLREHKLASPFSREPDFAFATQTGTPRYYRNVQVRGLDKAAERAGLNPDTGKDDKHASDALQKLRFHDLRHTFASHLIIDLRIDAAQVSRILGHAKPGITLDVYTHLFDQASHADDIRKRMADSAFARLLDQNLTS